MMAMGDPEPRPMWETDQRDEFRGRFGEDADAYDRTRPVAPDVLFDDLVDLAGLGPGAAVLEIGPGTGQATRPLAARGLRVLALEINARLAAQAKLNVAAFRHVEVQVVPFETWEPGRSGFDAVVACNSFHWIDPCGPVRQGRLRAAPGRLPRPDPHTRGDPRRSRPVLVGSAG